MKRFLQHYGYGIYLGGALSVFANIGVFEWQWWAISVPLIILICWSRKE